MPVAYYNKISFGAKKEVKKLDIDSFDANEPNEKDSISFFPEDLEALGSLNNINELVDIEIADLLTKQDKLGHIVLANLTADILIKLSKDLVNHIHKGGILICSGIIHERKLDVIKAFEQVGFKLSNAVSMGEWNGLKFIY